MSFYPLVYDLPEDELTDLAYYFESDDRGISGPVEQALADSIERWKADYPYSSLFRLDGPGDALTVCDRRRGWPARDHTLRGWARAAYLRRWDRPRTVKSLRTCLAELGHEVELTEVASWLAGCGGRPRLRRRRGVCRAGHPGGPAPRDTLRAVRPRHGAGGPMSALVRPRPAKVDGTW